MMLRDTFTALSFLWPFLLTGIALKFFPELVSRVVFRLVEHQSERKLAAFKDQLTRETNVHIEQVKADLQAGYSTLKSSVDFLSAGQSGLRGEIVSSVRPMWKAMIALRQSYNDLQYVHIVFTAEEIQEARSDKSGSNILQSVARFRAYDASAKILIEAVPEIVEESRLFAGERLWLIFSSAKTFYGRLGLLMHWSLTSREFRDWRKDSLITGALRAGLSKEALTALLATDRHRAFQMATAGLESEFVHEATRVMSGSRAVADWLSDMQATLLLHQQLARQQMSPD